MIRILKDAVCWLRGHAYVDTGHSPGLIYTKCRRCGISDVVFDPQGSASRVEQ